MTRGTIGALAIAAVVLAGAGARAEDEHGKIDWVRDPAVGLARAKLEGRPAMLYFGASW